MLIDESVIEAMQVAAALAPLHNQPALAAIRAVRAQMGAIPMIATFDTAFYADLPKVAALYAPPLELNERFGIRRFGFHGLAHRYMVERYRSLRPEVVKQGRGRRGLERRGIRHQIEDGVNGFLVDSVEETAQHIVQLVQDEALRRRFGEKAREAVKERFLMTRLMEEWLDLIGPFEPRFQLRAMPVS